MLRYLANFCILCRTGEYQDSSTGSELSESVRMPDEESDDGGNDATDITTIDEHEVAIYFTPSAI